MSPLPSPPLSPGCSDHSRSQQEPLRCTAPQHFFALSALLPWDGHRAVSASAVNIKACATDRCSDTSAHDWWQPRTDDGTRAWFNGFRGRCKRKRRWRYRVAITRLDQRKSRRLLRTPTTDGERHYITTPYTLPPTPSSPTPISAPLPLLLPRTHLTTTQASAAQRSF